MNSYRLLAAHAQAGLIQVKQDRIFELEQASTVAVFVTFCLAGRNAGQMQPEIGRTYCDSEPGSTVHHDGEVMAVGTRDGWSTVRSGGWEWMSAGDRLAFSFLFSLAAGVGLSIPIDLILPVPSTRAERFVTETVLDRVKLTSNINPYRRQNKPVFY